MLSNLATRYLLRNSNLRMAYRTDSTGSEFTLEFRKFFRNSEDTIVSPFHDIPVLANQDPPIYNMVVEVPRWSNAKMEIATKELLSPIKQDVKKGNLRFVMPLINHILTPQSDWSIDSFTTCSLTAGISGIMAPYLKLGRTRSTWTRGQTPKETTTLWTCVRSEVRSPRAGKSSRSVISCFVLNLECS